MFKLSSMKITSRERKHPNALRMKTSWGWNHHWEDNFYVLCKNGGKMFEEKVDCKESEKRLKNNPKVGINLSNIKPSKGKEKGKTNWCKSHT